MHRILHILYVAEDTGKEICSVEPITVFIAFPGSILLPNSMGSKSFRIILAALFQGQTLRKKKS